MRRAMICAGPGGNNEIRPFIERHRLRAGEPHLPDLAEQLGAQHHWGKGIILVPYLLDWADCCGIIERERAHVTILHSFPDPRDRTLALRTVSYWTRYGDDCTTALQNTLITAEPFAGYRWTAAALMDWWLYATDPGNCASDPPNLPPAAAFQAALDWIARVRPYWHSHTREPWPYTPADLLSYFAAANGAPELPASA